jgi:hypothetical protein
MSVKELSMSTTTNTESLISSCSDEVASPKKVNYFSKTAREGEYVRCKDGKVTVVTIRLGSARDKRVLPKGSSPILAVLFNGGKPAIDWSAEADW